MNILTLLRLLSEFETAVGKLYEWVSQMFANDPEAEFTFYRLSIEERGHVDLIEYQRRLVRKHPEAFGNVIADCEEISRLSERIAAARNGAPPSLSEAVAFALELETSAAEYHFRTAMQQASPDTARLLESLGKGDQSHLGQLREFAQRRGLAVPPK